MTGKKLLPALLLTGFTVLASVDTQAQYFYKDIINNREVVAEMARLKEQKMRTVNVISLESNGMESEGFFCQKKINKGFTEMEVFTSTSTSYPNLFTSIFSKEGMLKQTIDSSEVSATNTTYTYDNSGHILRISSVTNFADNEELDVVSEDHIYEYNSKGTATKLTVIKNNKDTTNILFQPDDNNQVAIEKNSRTAEIYYYYYDSKGRLTDIVHGYAGNPKLVPDYKFDYNAAGQVTQMIASEKEGAFFFTWKYNYDGGLRSRERCYSKEGTLLGSAEYSYK